MAETVEAHIVNFDELPLAFEARRKLSVASPDQKVTEAIASFKLTAKELEVLPSQ